MDLNTLESQHEGTADARVRGDHYEASNTEHKRERRTRGAAVTGNTRQRRRRTSHTARDASDGSAAAELGRALIRSRFMRQARSYPLPTAAEEIELAQRIEKGDLEAKDRMINSNLRLVVSQARRYQGHGLPMEDLVQRNAGADPQRSRSLDWRCASSSRPAGTSIRQAIQRGLQNHGRTIRVPVHVAQRQVKVRKAESQLSTKLGREPTDEDRRCGRASVDEVNAS